MENLEEGFRFRPTDEEALCFLLRFIAGAEMNDSGFVTTHVDTYSKQLEPWDIYSQGVPCGNDDEDNDCSQYRYFITKLKKKSEFRYSRNVGNKGSWKQNFKRKPIRKKGGPVIGYKKSMSYVINRQNGHWLMKEYDLSTKILDKFDTDCRDYVFCAIKKRTPTKDTTTSVPEECMNIVEHQTPVDAGENMQRSNSMPQLECMNMLEHHISAAYYEASGLQGGVVMDAGEYVQSNNLVECVNLEHQTSAAVASTSYYEALQGGGVMDAGEHMQSNSLELQNNMREGTSIVVEPSSAPYTFESKSMLDFDYEFSPADVDCLQSIIASLDNY